jgi:hypothetical protein
MSFKKLDLPNQELHELEGAGGPALTEHAAAIKALGKRVVADIIDIGRRLDECKCICGHGNWLPWLDREFGWSDKTAENFINVYKLGSKFENFSNLDLPLSGLYLLGAASTPDEARTEIVERAQAGESVPVAKIKRIIDTAKGARKPAIEQQVRDFKALCNKSAAIKADGGDHRGDDHHDGGAENAELRTAAVKPLTEVLAEGTASQLVDALESRLLRDGINAAPQLRKIRERIAKCKPQINLKAMPVMGAA